MSTDYHAHKDGEELSYQALVKHMKEQHGIKSGEERSFNSLLIQHKNHHSVVEQTEVIVLDPSSQLLVYDEGASAYQSIPKLTCFQKGDRVTYTVGARGFPHYIVRERADRHGEMCRQVVAEAQSEIMAKEFVEITNTILRMLPDA